MVILIFAGCDKKDRVKKNDGIYIYKKSFSPHGDVPFYIGKQIYNKKIYEELLQLSGVKSNNLENDYFPLYRKPTVD